MSPTPRESILRTFGAINVWSRGAERAPHKPLLVLLALGRLSRGEPDAVSFRELAPKLTELLQEFGPPRRSWHPEYPFWRLQRDGVWTVEGVGSMRRRTGQTDIPKAELLAKDAHGRLDSEIADKLRQEPALISEVAQLLLDGHFPVSLHEDILDAVGLDLAVRDLVSRRRRDPEFRSRVLTAYEHACAVCGFDVRLDHRLLGVEAAHIKWHQAGGPDQEVNGLALCSIHHKAFDLGAFTVQHDYRLLVSERTHGTRGHDEWLLRFHGHQVRRPVREAYRPGERFLAWHGREVFKGPPREH